MKIESDFPDVISGILSLIGIIYLFELAIENWF